MYTSNREVQIIKDAEILGAEYERCFHKRYGSKPFIDSADLVLFSFLSKNFGLERGREIIEHFLLMNDEWFLKQAHSPATLRKNVNSVIASLGKGQRSSSTEDLRISAWLYCDNLKCGVNFKWTGEASYLDNPRNQRLCPKCQHAYP